MTTNLLRVFVTCILGCGSAVAQVVEDPALAQDYWMSEDDQAPSESVDERAADDTDDPDAYAEFDSDLSPYGSWEEVPDYGRVWFPSVNYVGVEFSPYVTGGHWVYTEYGWTWVSDWDWGWAPFHYGRWLYASGRGWCWRPGRVWAPAWVSWRFGGGYVGWAPLGPRGVVVRAPWSPWHFCVAGELGQHRVRILPPQAAARIVGETGFVVNVRSGFSPHGVRVRYNAGPTLRHFGAPVPVRLDVVAPRVIAPHRVLPPPSFQAAVGSQGVRTVLPRAQARPFLQVQRPVPAPMHRNEVPIYHPHTPIYRPEPLMPSVYPARTIVPPPGYQAPAPRVQPVFRPAPPLPSPHSPAPTLPAYHAPWSPPMYHPAPPPQPTYRPAPAPPVYHAPSPPMYHVPSPPPYRPAPPPQPVYRPAPAPQPTYHPSTVVAQNRGPTAPAVHLPHVLGPRR